MRPGVLLFDLDGTLVDSAPSIAGALNRLRTERGGTSLPVPAVRPLVALGAVDLVTTGLGDLATIARDDLIALRTYLGEAATDPASLYPGVPEALAAIADQGWPMGIVTNKPAMLARRVLTDLGLADRFGAIVGGDTAAAPKPSAAPVRHALDLLGADADAALFVGDSGIDAAAARACTIPFLLFTSGYGAQDCAAADVAGRFARFADLPLLVASVAGSA